MYKVGSTRERKEEYKDAFLHQSFLVGWDPMGMNSTVVEMAMWKHLEFSFSSKRVNQSQFWKKKTKKKQSQFCISGETIDVSAASKVSKDKDWWFLSHP